MRRGGSVPVDHREAASLAACVAHPERLTRPGVLRGLVYRGGLRADVRSEGEIRTGDRVEALDH